MEIAMSLGGSPRDRNLVDRLATGAAETMARSTNCWLVTHTETGTPGARPVGPLRPEAEDDPWTVRFLMDGQSRKASEVRGAPTVAVLFQRGAEAFVSLRGKAALIANATERPRLWKPAYEALLPANSDRTCATFLVVRAERLEVWIRGLAGEPLEQTPQLLQRKPDGLWGLAGAREG
jgi:general stress protein 26